MSGVSCEEAVGFLNELIRLDQGAIEKLVDSRVICNKAMADHPTVQVMQIEDKPVVGILGILNGLFGKDENGVGYIRAVYNDLNQLERFDTLKLNQNSS